MHEKFSCHTKKQKAAKPPVPPSFPKGGIYSDKPLCPSLPKGKTSQIIARHRLFFKEKLAFIITSAHLFQKRERGNILPFPNARNGQVSSVSKGEKGAIFFRFQRRERGNFLPCACAFPIKKAKKGQKKGFFLKRFIKLLEKLCGKGAKLREIWYNKETNAL